MFGKYEKARDAKGMTDYEVAKLAGITPSVIAEWKRRAAESPDAELSVANAVKVANVLGCTVDEIIGQE